MITIFSVDEVPRARPYIQVGVDSKSAQITLERVEGLVITPLATLSRETSLEIARLVNEAHGKA